MAQTTAIQRGHCLKNLVLCKSMMTDSFARPFLRAFICSHQGTVVPCWSDVGAPVHVMLRRWEVAGLSPSRCPWRRDAGSELPQLRSRLGQDHFRFYSGSFCRRQRLPEAFCSCSSYLRHLSLKIGTAHSQLAIVVQVFVAISSAAIISSFILNLLRTASTTMGFASTPKNEVVLSFLRHHSMAKTIDESGHWRAEARDAGEIQPIEAKSCLGLDCDHGEGNRARCQHDERLHRKLDEQPRDSEAHLF